MDPNKLANEEIQATAQSTFTASSGVAEGTATGDVQQFGGQVFQVFASTYIPSYSAGG
jgi:hypothetical protein